MNISDLNTGQGNVEVEGTIKEVGEVRNINKFGRDIRVANAVLSDSSGDVKLTLWNEDVDNFKQGDKIKIVNGYVNEFQGEKQLTSGKFGKIEKVGEGEASADTGEASEEPEQKSEGSEDSSEEEPNEETAEEAGEEEEKPAEDY